LVPVAGLPETVSMKLTNESGGAGARTRMPCSPPSVSWK
jgi:hypothetical protein